MKCSFVLPFDVSGHNSEPLRARLPILLAADRFALAFDGPPESDQPLIWLAAPAARECVLDVLAAVGLSVSNLGNATTSGMTAAPALPASSPLGLRRAVECLTIEPVGRSLLP